VTKPVDNKEVKENKENKEEVKKIIIKEKQAKLMNPTQPTKTVRPENNIVTVSDKIAAPLESIVNEFTRLYEIERKYDRMI
jgi:nitric oxide reductase large subunit